MVATTGHQLADQIAAAYGVGGVVCDHNLASEDWLPEHAAVAGVVDCCWVLLYGRRSIWKKTLRTGTEFIIKINVIMKHYL